MLNDSLAAAFSASQYSIGVNLRDVSHEESLRPPAPGGNCINWIAGHILAARNTILARLGEEPYLGDDEAKPYRRGSQGLASGDRAVEIERLRGGLEVTGRRIVARLGAIDSEQLEAELEASALPVPLEQPTVGALLTFLLFHEGYHVGQLGLGRRLVGKAGAIT